MFKLALALFACAATAQPLQSSFSSAKSTLDSVSAGFDVYETIIDSPEAFLVWSAGDTSTVMFVVSTSGQAYRSPDDGQTFVSLSNSTLLTPQMSQSPTATFTVADALVGSIVSVDADFSRFWFMKANGQSYWTTKDAGATFQYYASATSSAPVINWVVPHETNPDVAVAITLSEDLVTASLYITVNFGQSWTMIDSNIEASSIDFVTAGLGSAAFAVLYLSVPQAGSATCYFGCTAVIANIDASGNVLSKESLYNQVDLFAVVNWAGGLGTDTGLESIVVSRILSNGPAAGATALTISRDDGATWRTAFFPFFTGNTTQADYVVAVSENGVGDIIAGRRSQDFSSVSTAATWMTLFMSRTPTSTAFVEILPYVVTDSSGSLYGKIDVDIAHGVDGVLLANSFRVLGSQNDSSGDGGPDVSCIQTHVSFNYGVAWTQPLASTADCAAALGAAVANGAGTTASNNPCALQLYGLVTDVIYGDRFYSVDGAPGIWFAPGHIGTCMNTTLDPTLTTLFVSNDFGKSWRAVGAGTNTYEIGARGSVLVTAVADGTTPTNQMNYSIDFGASFLPTTLTSVQPLLIANVETPTSAYTGDNGDFAHQSFLMYGSRLDSNNNTVGVLLGLNFQKAFSAQCTTADLTAVTPSTDLNGAPSCSLGEIKTYYRRTTGATCDVTIGEPVVATSVSCPCTDSDYQCDTCYARDATGVCQKQQTQMCSAFFNMMQGCAPWNNYAQMNVNVSSGYRLVPNNVCNATADGAVVHTPASTPCVKPCAALSCSDCAASTTCHWCGPASNFTLGACENIGVATSSCSNASNIVATQCNFDTQPPTPAPGPPVTFVNGSAACGNLSCTTCALAWRTCAFCSTQVTSGLQVDWSAGVCESLNATNVCAMTTSHSVRTPDQCTMSNTPTPTTIWGCASTVESTCISGCGNASSVSSCNCSNAVPTCFGALCSTSAKTQCAAQCSGSVACDCTALNAGTGGLVCPPPAPAAVGSTSAKKGLPAVAVAFIVIACLAVVAVLVGVAVVVIRGRKNNVTVA